MRGIKAVTLTLTLFLLPLAIAATLTDIETIPEQPIRGESFKVTYTISNDEPLRHVSTDVELLGVINERFSDNNLEKIYTFTEEFMLPKDYEEGQLYLLITPIDQKPIFHTIPIRTKIKQPQRGAEGITISVQPPRDALPGEGIYYGVTITNNEENTEAVTLGLSGVRTWATYRVDPAPTITIPQYSEETAFIYLRINEDAPTGRQDFFVTAEHGGTTEDAPISIAILPTQEIRESNDQSPGIILIVIALIIIAGAIIYVAYQHKKRGDDDELTTYY